ncbi:MAG: FliG C-terminal domain-containing protein [Candidatus Latescibacteria bacterium]|jgi:hypothetical protein|nr:hypothetical protein [Gemmatimonadaceae bacterium]MDP6016663.1 FliG C-terminal domain-containing protein [Candidatus Latescibacterota bacterium]MDP7447599.1 FliG C-terminal domain-containing protein [Candidatus Latescibacterota bacterium]HJP31712.1 FliG C-terminal domain-containing protein [Candidatus Latescibacterota bacterium]
MSISLPARANLEFLKKQSKQLRQAFADGEADAASRIRQYLPRAGKLTDDELQGMELSLQEAQHALACEYGCAKWEELLAAVNGGGGFDALVHMTDRETQILMREVDQADLVRALVGAPEPVVERFLGNMSERVREFIGSEIEFVGDLPAAEIDDARTRLLAQVRSLPEWITWPPDASDTPSSTSPPPPDDPRLDHIARPLLELSEEELAGTIRALADRARKLGILSLEACIRGLRGTLLTEGIRLTVDGTEPALVVDMLEIRAATILRNRTIRGHMAIEGWMAIQSGDNPAIVAQKLTTYFVEEPVDEVAPRREPTADDLAAMLRQTPMHLMTLAQLVEFFRDMAFLARHRGVIALAPIVDLVGEPILSAAMAESVQANPGGARLMEVMQPLLQEQRVALHRRHCLVIKGMAGIQAGKKPDVLVTEAQQWAQEQGEALGPASTPSPTTPL